MNIVMVPNGTDTFLFRNQGLETMSSMLFGRIVPQEYKVPRPSGGSRMNNAYGSGSASLSAAGGSCARRSQCASKLCKNVHASADRIPTSPLFAGFCRGGPKDHIDIRISHSGSKAQ